MEKHDNCLRASVFCTAEEPTACLTCGWYVAEHRRRIDGGLVTDPETGRQHYVATKRPEAELPEGERPKRTPEEQKAYMREYMHVYRIKKGASVPVKIIGADAED